MKNIEPQPARFYEPFVRRVRDYAKETPVGDDAFAVIRRLYAYDPLPLDAKVEGVEETPDWRKETVTISAPYGDERIIVYLYLPRSAPPYQPRDLRRGRRRAAAAVEQQPETDRDGLRGAQRAGARVSGLQRHVRANRQGRRTEYRARDRDSARQGPAAGRRFHRVETRPRSSAHRLLRAQPGRVSRPHRHGDRAADQGERAGGRRSHLRLRCPRKSIPSTSRPASACRR